MKRSRLRDIISLILMFACTVLLAVSCSRVQYVPGPSIHDTIYNNKVSVDSFISHDSVFVNVYQQGDTVYKDKYKYVYKDRVVLRYDTVYVSKLDSVFVPVKVDYKPSKWESMKMNLGGLAMLIIVLFIIVRFVRTRR